MGGGEEEMGWEAGLWEPVGQESRPQACRVVAGWDGGASTLQCSCCQSQGGQIPKHPNFTQVNVGVLQWP